MGLTLEIEECLDCPRLEKRKTTHFLIYPRYGWTYTCNKVGRIIMPSDGMNPPPKWCPLREENKK